jgi:predicted SPOUT superfamily RNA methylase MTH1
MTGKHLGIAIPASVIADTPHLREKTFKVGSIARAAAIFRVNEIIVYADNLKENQSRDIDLIAELLSYIETPQYLRKRLFKIKPELQYAGILPPLRTPHHPITGRIRDLQVGSYREGITLSKVKEGTLVDIGSEHPAVLNGEKPVNQRITVKITKIGERIEVQEVPPKSVPEYWGYAVSIERAPLAKIVQSRIPDLTIATSKFATLFQDAVQSLTAKWAKAHNILLLFGAPTRGLFEIAKDEGANLNDIADFVLNTVPNQGTETVRTEEALLATLAILNVEFGF